MKPLRSMRRLGLPILALAFAFSGASGALARTLSWPSIEVTARLDAEGRLHVVETQTLRMSGDWNGGERIFHLSAGSDLDLHGITRVDPASGRRVELSKGDLDEVDRYDWDEGRLRWRSRLVSDPPFEDELLVYVLDYTLERILVQRGESYLFDHDFAFADRAGTIERFTVELELDPVWRPRGDLPRRFELEDLYPGMSAPISAALAYTGPGRPSAALGTVPLATRLAILAAALLAILYRWLELWRHEAAAGRLDRPEVPGGLEQDWLERDWLEAELFDLGPEGAGALWDRRVGAAEVAALLARLVAEDKLASSVEEGGLLRRKVLRLELLTERSAFNSYERKVIDKLFFDGREETDTRAVRRHYRKKGLDLAGLIRKPIERRLEQHRALDPPRKLPSAGRPWWIFLLVLVLFLLEGLSRGAIAAVVFASLMLTAPVPAVVGSVSVARYRQRTSRPRSRLLWILACGLLLLFVCYLPALLADLGLVVSDLNPGIFGVLAMAVFPLFVFALWTSLARTSDGPRTVRRRLALGEIRSRFRAELAKEEPGLEDAWMPYLIALGLDREVDGWFRSFGVAASPAGSLGATSTSGFGGTSRGWSGGGGAFGGAGATSSWAAAATGLAAGVASSSSSSGSSGGGSFSGGGGGGGW